MIKKLFHKTGSRQRGPVFVLLLALTVSAGAGAEEKFPLETITLPGGFSIELFARVDGARSLAVVPELDTVFVASRGDTITALSLDGKTTHGTIGGLKVPNAIAWKDGYLYVAEQHRLVRFAITGPGKISSANPEVLYDALPDKRWHGWRYMQFGPDGTLYVAIGAPCNICLPGGLEGTITAFSEQTGWQPQVYARGIRNSVGIAFHPETGDMYFTDNGADNMGDDSPPDELNRADKPDMHFGYPYYGGGRDRTGNFASAKPAADAAFPEVNFQAHVAPLGVHFYTGHMFPEEMQGDAFVAQHGSWNRSTPVGYRVMRIRFDAENKVTASEPFAHGWLDASGDYWGRPVDIRQLPDGSMLVSDDGADALWRIFFHK